MSGSQAASSRMTTGVIGRVATRLRGRLTRSTVWLAAAWLCPITTHLLGVDWLLPLLVVVFTAALLRSGRTLLDRIMLATGLLLGAVCVAGLIFTGWPFGLAPVTVAGTALSVLGLVHVFAGRSLSLPAPSLLDGVAALAAAGVAVYLAQPYLRASSTGRLALAMVGEDNARHFSLFDAIRRLGGYTFGSALSSVPEVFDRTRYYPPGWHLTAGLLDGFVRSSSSELGTTSSALDHYVGFAVAGYGLFTLAVIWATLWVGGPVLRSSYRFLPVMAFIAGILIYSDIPTLLTLGFVSEVLGLTLLALLVALVARPVRPFREQMVLLGALLIGISYTYYFLLPAAVLATVGWLWWYRETAMRHRALLIAMSACVAAFGAIPPIFGLLGAGLGEAITGSGGVNRVSRATLIALAALIGAGLFTHAGRRLRVWHRYVWALACTIGVAAALGAYQLAAVGHTTYFFEKSLHGVAVVLLLGLGGVALLLPVPRRVPPSRLRLRIGLAMPVASLSVAIVAVLGLVVHDSPYRPTIRANPGRWWASGEPGELNVPDAAIVHRVAGIAAHRQGTVDVVLLETPYQSFRATLFLTTLQRNSALAGAVLYNGSIQFAHTPEQLAEVLRKVAGTVRVFVATTGAQDVVERIRRAAPDLHLELITVSP